MLSSGYGQNGLLFAGSQEEELEGTEVHAEGRSGLLALLRSNKGKYLPVNTNKKAGHAFHLQHLFLLSLLLTDWTPTGYQSDDPLGSIHLRGSVVTAVESAPDGELQLQEMHAPSGNTANTPWYWNLPPICLFRSPRSAKKHDVDGNLFEIITSEETHYFFQAATSDERKEWINAIQSVLRIGKWKQMAAVFSCFYFLLDIQIMGLLLYCICASLKSGNVLIYKTWLLSLFYIYRVWINVFVCFALYNHWGRGGEGWQISHFNRCHANIV